MIRAGLLASVLLATGAASAQTVPLATAEPQVEIVTTAGPIVVEVETAKAPITSANFLRYVDQKRLDGVDFYRIVKVADHFGFVQFGIDGDPRRALPPIAHEPTTLTGLHHVDGTLSMPRREPGTAQGEFTISVGDQSPSFDADPSKPGDNLGYAAFGHVVQGMDVVVKIMDATVSPDATLRGAFKGEVPEVPVKIVSARRIGN